MISADGEKTRKAPIVLIMTEIVSGAKEVTLSNPLVRHSIIHGHNSVCTIYEPLGTSDKILALS